MHSFNNLLHSSKTAVMGIVNVTPDSFSDGGVYFDLSKAMERIVHMQQKGADIIDIGGESTRPGSDGISVSEELRRVIPVISEIRKSLSKDMLISIDTYKAEVAEKALDAGANIVNSLGGFIFDPKLAKVIARYACPLIIYHIKGTPREMQKGDIVYNNVVEDIKVFFTQQIDFANSQAIKTEQILLDPGIGFGKTLEHNISIIRHFDQFNSFGLPTVFGTSRKSHIGMLLQKELGLEKTPSPLERLEGSLAETAIAVVKGAKIVRTHDVEETKKFLAVLDTVK